MNNLYLTGFMGSGKTTVGKELSKKLGRQLVDMDKLIEDDAEESIKSIFETKGEAYFRDLETKLLKSIQNMDGVIVSTGGGIVLREENKVSMKASGKVIFLHASEKHLVKHLKQDKTRPLLQAVDLEKQVTQLLADRESHYLKVADIIIQATDKSIKEIVDEIVTIL